jgi:hypothetical protein
MKRKNVIILFALFTTLLVVLSCTLPIYIVSESESKESATAEKEVIVVTATPEATTEPTSTPTLAVTPTVMVYLDGPWTIWEGTDQERLDIDFLQDGFSVTGNAATDDGYSILYEGIISYDGTTVSGTWRSTKGISGNFVFYLDSSYSVFGGNMGGGVPFCGNRLSAKKPSPCLQ